MTKTFAACSLADLAYELQLAVCDESGSALSSDIVVARIIPCLLDHTHTKAVLQRHPRVGGSGGLVCSAAAESKQVWCSMLRDLFLSAGVSVSNAAQLRVYLVVKQCAKLGRVRLPHLLVAGRWCLQLFAALEQLHGARVFLRVCNAQGAALVRIQLSPAAQRLRLRTLVPVYEMAMGHRQRLRGMGCGGRGKLALLMSQGGGGDRPVSRDCSALMDRIVRRVAAAQVAATPEGLHAKAQALRAAGECAAAAALLQQAVGHGHVPSRADLAGMLIEGRESVAKDRERGFELAEEGARLGCHSCQGVMAMCYLFGAGCSQDAPRSLALARASAGEGSKYGQRTLGWLYREGLGGVGQDHAAAVAQYRLAAAQGYDAAQNALGHMYGMGYGVAQDYAEALHWHKLAAAQGYGQALMWMGRHYEEGLSVAADKAEAIRWYKRAAASGHSHAAKSLMRLGA
jgi:TPR repeat protein